MDLENTIHSIMSWIIGIGGIGNLLIVPNAISYSRTKEILRDDLTDNVIDKKNWEKYKEYSLQGRIFYYLGYIGRERAYAEFENNKIKEAYKNLQENIGKNIKEEIILEDEEERLEIGDIKY